MLRLSMSMAIRHPLWAIPMWCRPPR
jgi:hypothetical protein